MTAAESRWVTPLYAAAVLGGAVLIVATALAQPFNQNELVQMAPYASGTVREILDATRQPPLDPLLGAAVRRVLGEGQLLQRLVPVLAGIGTLTLFALLLRRLRLGSAARSRCSCSRRRRCFLRWTAYSRPYALPVFLMLLFVYAGHRWLVDRQAQWLLLAVPSAVLLPLARVPEPMVFLCTTAAVLALLSLRGKLEWRATRPLVAATLGASCSWGCPWPGRSPGLGEPRDPQPERPRGPGQGRQLRAGRPPPATARRVAAVVAGDGGGRRARRPAARPAPAAGGVVALLAVAGGAGGVRARLPPGDRSRLHPAVHAAGGVLLRDPVRPGRRRPHGRARQRGGSPRSPSVPCSSPCSPVRSRPPPGWSPSPTSLTSARPAGSSPSTCPTTESSSSTGPHRAVGRGTSRSSRRSVTSTRGRPWSRSPPSPPGHRTRGRCARLPPGQRRLPAHRTLHGARCRGVDRSDRRLGDGRGVRPVLAVRAGRRADRAALDGRAARGRGDALGPELGHAETRAARSMARQLAGQDTER